MAQFYESYDQTFVTNSSALLADGKTVNDLAVGQIGIFDAKTNLAVTHPTYAKNKAIYLAWGKKKVPNSYILGVSNHPIVTKRIIGKRVLDFTAVRSQYPQTPLYTIGWSGAPNDNDKLFQGIGQSKDLWIQLTGYAIDRLYSTNGLTKLIMTDRECYDQCGDGCGNVDCRKLVHEIVRRINKDKDFNKFIRAKGLIDCENATAPATEPCYKFTLSVCDTGDDRALGLVEAQYPDNKVFKEHRKDAITTYAVVSDQNAAPAAYVAKPTVVAECDACPSGATQIAAGIVYQVKVAHGATPALPNQLSSTLIVGEINTDVYLVVVKEGTTDEQVQQAAQQSGAEQGVPFEAVQIGFKRSICVLPETTYNWAADTSVTLQKQAKNIQIILADTDCGTDRLEELQKAYPHLTISIADAGDSCVHTYQAQIWSKCYEAGCARELVEWIHPQPFEGAEWKPAPVTETTADGCKCGVLIETAFVNRKTNDCTFGYFPYEFDVVHVQASNYNMDYNADPCENEWVFKTIKDVKYPVGNGSYIQYLERDTRGYDNLHWDFNPVVREMQGYHFVADPDKYYDKYILKFEHDWKTGSGWGQEYSDTYRVHVFLPEGQGDAFANAINGYVTSVGIDLDAASI